jgi:hypothetical protein
MPAIRGTWLCQILAESVLRRELVAFKIQGTRKVDEDRYSGCTHGQGTWVCTRQIKVTAFVCGEAAAAAAAAGLACKRTGNIDMGGVRQTDLLL